MHVQFFNLVIGVVTEAKITLDSNSCSNYFNGFKEKTAALTCKHANSEVSVPSRNTFFHPYSPLSFSLASKSIVKKTFNP